MFDYASRIAQQCVLICERNGDFKSAEDIKHKFFLTKPPCALLAPKANNEDSSD